VFVLEEAPRADATEHLLIRLHQGQASVGGCACVKSTHSQHSSTSPAGEMSLAHRAPITRFVRLPISSPSGPPALSLDLLLPSRCAICCFCKYLNHSVFIRSTPRMSWMNSFPYSYNAYGWMCILTLLGSEPLFIVIIAFRVQETVCVVCSNLNLIVNSASKSIHLRHNLTGYNDNFAHTLKNKGSKRGFLQ